MDFYFSNIGTGIKLRYKTDINDNSKFTQYINLGTDGSLLQFGGGIETTLTNNTALTFETASLNYTPLLENSIFSKLYIKRNDSCLGVGYFSLPGLYSSWTDDIYLPGRFTTLFGMKEFKKNKSLNEKFIIHSKLDIYGLLAYEFPHTPKEIRYFNTYSYRTYERDIQTMAYISECEINPRIGLQYKLSDELKAGFNYGLESSMLQLGRWILFGAKTSFITYMYIESKFQITLLSNISFDFSLLLPLKTMLYKDERNYFNTRVIIHGKKEYLFNFLYSWDINGDNGLMFSFGPNIRKFNLSLYANIQYENKQLLYASSGIRLTSTKNRLSISDNPREYSKETKETFNERITSINNISGATKTKIDNMTSTDFNEVVQQLQTPDEVRAYTNDKFTYISTDKVIPITPLEVFQNSGGDCDEQSRFQSYILKQHGYESYVVTYSARPIGHGICLYRDKETNKWNAIEYGKTYKIDADTIEELISQIEPTIFRYRIDDPDEGYKGLSFIRSETPKNIQKWFWEKDEVR